MPWPTAVSDLRTQLSDNIQDRFNSEKRCFGPVNGTNVLFRSFEFRRVTNFTTAVFPMGVYVDEVLLPASGIATDDPTTGYFQLVTPPQNGSVVEATYYLQWFLDSELQFFLTTAAQWFDGGSDYTVYSGGMIPCLIKYACAEAYLKMAQKWRTWMSEMYRVEDQPKKPGFGPVDSFIKMAQDFRTEAEAARKEFYTRQDRNLQPLFGINLGNVKPMP